jgi:hypothetical protein
MNNPEQIRLKAMDSEINALFRKQDALKAAGCEGGSEYMQLLYELRDKTRARLGVMDTARVL